MSQASNATRLFPNLCFPGDEGSIDFTFYENRGRSQKQARKLQSLAPPPKQTGRVRPEKKGKKPQSLAPPKQKQPEFLPLPPPTLFPVGSRYEFFNGHHLEYMDTKPQIMQPAFMPPPRKRSRSIDVNDMERKDKKPRTFKKPAFVPPPNVEVIDVDLLE